MENINSSVFEISSIQEKKMAEMIEEKMEKHKDGEKSDIDLKLLLHTGEWKEYLVNFVKE